MAEIPGELLQLLLATAVGLFSCCRLTDARLVLHITSRPRANTTCYNDPSSSLTTAILVQYRMTEETTDGVEDQLEWRSVGCFNFDFSSCVGERLFTSCALNLSSYVQERLIPRSQVRLLQQNHRGEGCDCWRVTAVIVDATLEWNVSDFQNNLCDVQGQQESNFFCGPQNESRGFVTQVLGTSYCPSGSNLSINRSGSVQSDSQNISR